MCALLSPDKDLPLPSQEAAAQHAAVPLAHDSSDSEIGSDEEDSCPWYSVWPGAHKLPVPAQDFLRMRNGLPPPVSCMPFPDLRMRVSESPPWHGRLPYGPCMHACWCALIFGGAVHAGAACLGGRR